METAVPLRRREAEISGLATGDFLEGKVRKKGRPSIQAAAFGRNLSLAQVYHDPAGVTIYLRRTFPKAPELSERLGRAPFLKIFNNWPFLLDISRYL